MGIKLTLPGGLVIEGDEPGQVAQTYQQIAHLQPSPLETKAPPREAAPTKEAAPREAAPRAQVASRPTGLADLLPRMSEGSRKVLEALRTRGEASMAEVRELTGLDNQKIGGSITGLRRMAEAAQLDPDDYIRREDRVGIPMVIVGPAVMNHPGPIM